MISEQQADILSSNANITVHPTISTYYVLSCKPRRALPQDLYISFTLTPLESVRYSSDERQVLKIQLLSSCHLLTVEKEAQHYYFEQGVYRNRLMLSSTGLGKTQVTELKSGVQNRVRVKLSTKEQFSNCIFLPTVSIGSKDHNYLKCQIQGLRLHWGVEEGKSENSDQCKMPNLQDQEGALDTIPTNHCPDLNALMPYSSPQVNTDNSLFLCHDMMGGYTQDITSHTSSQQNFKHSYRSLHLPQARIFNYFSHHLITVPPKHWRRLCEQNQTLCLGTFIVEHPGYPEQETYLSRHCADILVYLARKHRFDGYLINIERKVKDLKALMGWLEFLSDKIHKAIPHSQIIWYDSVSLAAESYGEIKYQNQLNFHNIDFLTICDGIFLNYWWNEEKLVRSLQNRKKYGLSKKMIYVGSDCFGRGTFGGGKYDTYKAIKTIEKINEEHNTDSPLVPALFAMGYTYENHGSTDPEIWKQNQLALYRGTTLQEHKLLHTDPKWTYVNKNINGFAWAMEGDEAVTSFRVCQRVYRNNLKSLLGTMGSGTAIIKFMSTVRGTGPNFADHYNVSMKILMMGQGQALVLNQVTTGAQKSEQKEKKITLWLEIDCELCSEGNVGLEIIEEGKDAENWGGHYGTRFKEDTLFLQMYDPEKDWALNRPRIPVVRNLPYLSTYNLGHNREFYYFGKGLEQSKRAYSFLSDMDCLSPYFMNSPLAVEINYSDSFLGGNSLKINFARSTNQKIGLLHVDCFSKGIIIKIVLKPLISTNSIQKLKVLNELTSKESKNNLVLQFQLKDKDKGRFEPHKIAKLQNQWLLYCFEVKEMIERGGNISLLCHNQVNEWTLGGIQIQQLNCEYPKSAIMFEKIQMKLSEDFIATACSISAHLRIILCKDKEIKERILLKVDESYVCICYPQFDFFDEVKKIYHYSIYMRNVDFNPKLNQKFHLTLISMASLEKQILLQTLIPVEDLLQENTIDLK